MCKDSISIGKKKAEAQKNSFCRIFADVPVTFVDKNS